jgi:superoxide dismutase, Cu-Zn family
VKKMKQKIASAAATAAITAGAAGAATLAPISTAAEAQPAELTAVLRDPSGIKVGVVEFRTRGTDVEVRATLRPNPYVAANAFHGFHVHANNDPGNGTGCIADPMQASSTWFVSADGHLTDPGQTHGHHSGDMPSPLVEADGTARLRFTTHAVDLADLAGRAVVLHGNPDNFGNVPTGSADTEYTPNGPAATDLTQRTGNAGARAACGLIQSRD